MLLLKPPGRFEDGRWEERARRGREEPGEEEGSQNAISPGRHKGWVITLLGWFHLGSFSCQMMLGVLCDVIHLSLCKEC